jgi:DNA-directed RNA polymerase specialized sigma24 family protein
MPEQNKSLSDLLEKAWRDSDGSAREVVERYAPYILRAVRRRLDKKLRSKFDSTDFVQAVWASFFAMPPDRLQFQKHEELVNFLMGLARNKVVDVVRQRLETEKYNVRRETPLFDSTTTNVRDVVGKGPTASQVAIAKEEWQRAENPKTPRDERIVNWIRRGQSLEAIAREIGVSVKTIQRVLHRMAQHQAERGA